MDKPFLKVKILRQDNPGGSPYWETFHIPAKKGATVQDVLSAIQESPMNAGGKPVSPVVWECNCIEEVCGACAMNICGRPGMACGTLVDSVIKSGDKPLVLAPLSKYPVIRDLVVDRSRIFETYKRYRLYVSPETALKSGEKRLRKKAKWEDVYPFTRCLSCGSCAEICPNVSINSLFCGAVGMSISKVLRECGACEDISGFIEKGGVAGCSGFSMCSGACPKNIDLPSAVANVNRDIHKQMWRKITVKAAGKRK